MEDALKVSVNSWKSSLKQHQIFHTATQHPLPRPAGKFSDLCGLDYLARPELPESTWGQDSRCSRSMLIDCALYFYLFIFLQALHYSKCVCFAVVLQSATAITLFHRLEGKAEMRSFDPLWMLKEWQSVTKQVDEQLRSSVCVMLQQNTTWHDGMDKSHVRESIRAWYGHTKWWEKMKLIWCH